MLLLFSCEKKKKKKKTGYTKGVPNISGSVAQFRKFQYRAFKKKKKLRLFYLIKIYKDKY